MDRGEANSFFMEKVENRFCNVCVRINLSFSLTKPSKRLVWKPVDGDQVHYETGYFERGRERN